MINPMEFSDRELVDRTYENAVIGLTGSILCDNKRWYKHIMNLSEAQKSTYMLAVLNLQVLNGGFGQYFDNQYGIFAFETIEVLQKIGAIKTANLLAEALRLVNAKNESPSDFRNQLSMFFSCDNNELSSALDKLNNQYYNWGKEAENDDLEVLLANYLRKI